MIRPIANIDPLAGHHTLNVARTTPRGIKSLYSLPLAPRLGEAPNGYHPFSVERIERGRQHFLARGKELGRSAEEVGRLYEKFLGAFRCIDPITYRQGLIQMGLAIRAAVISYLINKDDAEDLAYIQSHRDDELKTFEETFDIRG